MHRFEPTRHQFRRCIGAPFALSVGVLLALAGCGGGGSGQADLMQTPASTSTVSAVIEATDLPADIGSAVAQPTFHLAPVLLPAPSDTDAINNVASAQAAPHAQGVTTDDAALGTQHLTVQALQANARARALSTRRTADGAITPAAATGTATTYTPAQIRAAYAFPALPASSVVPTALQAAQQGAGQTIYIVDAMHNPNVAAELAAFNSKFGLPGCTSKTVATSAALPLASASAADGCSLTVVYSTPSGAMTAAAPAYDAGWATEIALDVQWAHATAPRARIILIEAGDASLNGLLGGLKLANAMGPGSVSMSFGVTEGNWTSQVDSAFAAAGMTYLAATGDSGSAVSWPAVSPNVLAVGGTTLTYSGTSPRSETAWSKGGGGISAYTATPAFQSNKVPGLGTLAHRAVADVSFNADPYTGQYVAVMPKGSSSVSWVSAGGTSLSTPQWAGLVAVANALRAQSAKAALGAPHVALYTQIAQVPGTYAASFGDISSGSDGTCATCSAKTGYDVPTGLGTPNVTALLMALGGAAGTTVTAPAAPIAPIVSAATVSGKVGSALSYTVSVSGGAATNFTLTGAPGGMTITSGGVISWSAPVAGTYAVTVTAANASSGLSGKGVISVVIAAATPPVITAPAITGTVGKPLSGAITVSSPSGSSLSIQITGVPSGVNFSVSGQSLLLNWPSPVAGKYSLSIAARDSAGLTTSSTLSIVVNAK
ncbi:MAG: S53 family peptidase [Burkholderiales bacterium]|nr:S53 family peptidase [Burkholderiales bacterium]